MLKLARWSTTHRRLVVVVWIALIVAVGTLAQSAGTEYSNNFTLPNSDAQRASDLLEHSFPAQAGDRDQIVFRVASGSVLKPAVRTRMSAMFAQVAKLPHVAAVISPYAGPSAGKAVSANKQIAFATVVFDEKANLLPVSAAKRVVSVAQAARRSGLEVELGGQAIEATQQVGFGLSTAVGLLAAIVVLLLTFGSLVAMGLPIVTALFGLGTGLSLIALFTHVVDTPNFSSELAAMIGLGVGIDYSLFILTRFREAYAGPGATHGRVKESVVQAMDTAGRAVLFAGTTVVIALLGMMLLGVDFLYGVALSASIGVLLVMLSALTLLPALLTFAGARLARPGRLARQRERREAAASVAGASAAGAAGSAADNGSDNGSTEGLHSPAAGRAWLRWSAFVQSRPRTIAVTATLVMLVIAAPAIALRLGSSDASNDPVGQTTYKAYRLLAKGFGEGFNGPLQVVVRQPHRGDSAALGELERTLAATPGVASVAPPRLSPTGEVATISVYPSSSPQAYATTQLVQHLRAAVIPPVAARTGATVYVGGVTAGTIDFATVLGHKLPLFIGVVVLLSALLLMVVFRSLVIPLQAAVMNLLSIGASMGVIVAIFQWGWLPGLMGVSAGPIESFIPVMLFAIVFGLSMDYEVFLVSRIHEQWTRTRDHKRAVGEGLALTGRVVTAAAAIMVCVFLSFVLGEERVIKEFGLALASAVFLDAVIVRCLLLPAVLDLVGERTWWIPAWLDRVLPRVNIEGTSARDAAPGEQELSLNGASRRRQKVG
ncbi:MAG TPA: MMPL family transporter [Solirubrobacteraceae bacterium]|jgi:RND superfamily putative drug exporter|nr:MMPL family transporter [Solirubrobacteraceae bacterium]